MYLKPRFVLEKSLCTAIISTAFFQRFTLFLQDDLFINVSIFTGMLQRRNHLVNNEKHKLFYLEGSSGMVLQCRAHHLSENEALFAGYYL